MSSELAGTQHDSRAVPVADSPSVAHVLRLTSAAAIGVGILLRLVQLLMNRSLSQDEAQLALNIMNRPFGRLFGQLDYNQAAPDGFLAAQKLVVGSLGASDYSLRLVAFIAGMFALALFLFLARGAVSAVAVPIAVGLFAASEPVIYYATSDKQYAVDVFVAVSVMVVGLRLGEGTERRRATAIFAAVGAASVWLSHSSVFVLAGVSSALVADAIARRRLGRAVRLSAASVPWLASFGIFAVTSLGNVAGIRDSLSHSSGVFAGGDSSGWSDTGAVRTSLGAFRYIAGVPHFFRHGAVDAGELVAVLVAILCVRGFASLCTRHPVKAAVIVGPLGFMLIAWGLGEYPLLGRTQLFLVPSYVLLLAEGIACLLRDSRHPAFRAASIAVAGAVIVALASPAFGRSVRSPTSSEIKPVLEHIAREERPGDAVYAYYTAQPQLRYYLECRCAGAGFEAAQRRGLWPLRPGVGGTAQFAPALLSVPPRLFVAQYRGADPLLYEADFAALRDRTRVWVLVPEVEDATRKRLLQELDRHGTLRATFGVGDVHDFASAVVVYLYDMRR